MTTREKAKLHAESLKSLAEELQHTNNPIRAAQLSSQISRQMPILAEEVRQAKQEERAHHA